MADIEKNQVEEEVVYDFSEEMIEEEMDDAADSLAPEEAPAAEEAPAEPILMMSAAPKFRTLQARLILRTSFRLRNAS